LRAVLRDAFTADVEIGKQDIRRGVAFARGRPEPLRGGRRIALPVTIAQVGERGFEFWRGGPSGDCLRFRASRIEPRG